MSTYVSLTNFQRTVHASWGTCPIVESNNWCRCSRNRGPVSGARFEPQGERLHLSFPADRTTLNFFTAELVCFHSIDDRLVYAVKLCKIKRQLRTAPLPPLHSPAANPCTLPSIQGGSRDLPLSQWTTGKITSTVLYHSARIRRLKWHRTDGMELTRSK